MNKKWRVGLLIVAVVLVLGLFMLIFSCTTEEGSDTCLGYGKRCARQGDCCDGLFCDDEGEVPGNYICQ